MPTTASFTDDFTTIGAGKWNNWGCTLDSGRLALNAYGDQLSSVATDLTFYESSITFQMARYPDVANGAFFGIEFIDVVAEYMSLGMYFHNGDGAGLSVGAGAGGWASISSPVDGDWWRFALSGTTLSASRSADGVTGWATIHTSSMIGCPWDYTVGAGFICILEYGLPVGAPVLLDNLNLPPSEPPPATGPKSVMWV